MIKKHQNFIKFVKKECKNYGIKINLVNKKFIILNENDSMETCGGYFDAQDMVLACATKRPDFVDTLVHEYCHMTQWLDNCYIWRKVEKYDSLDKLSRWLNGENIRNIKFHIGLVRDLELDNEKRSVELIKKFNLSIDVKLYIKKANSYIQFYNHMYYSRKWCNDPNMSPYKVKQIYDNMPSKFNMNYSSMSNKVKRIFDAVYI